MSPEDYVAFQEKYAPYTKANEFLTIPEALDAVTTWTISLMMDVVTRCFIGVGRKTMEEALKSLQIRPQNPRWLGSIFPSLVRLRTCQQSPVRQRIATVDFILEITMTRENFMVIPNILLC